MAQPLILIVEDDSIMADTLASMVQLLGYQTNIAHNSRGALAAAMRNPPDLILLDLNLPDVDGIEVCRYFRREPSLITTPIIIVSVEGSPDTIERAKNVGANLYLIKPVGLDDLEAAIAETLR